ncbi:MAG: hypothetical protein WA971_07530 [Microbacterium sp.]
MSAEASRHRLCTVALWAAFGVLAWALLTVFLGTGTAHADDDQGEGPRSAQVASSAPQRPTQAAGNRGSGDTGHRPADPSARANESAGTSPARQADQNDDAQDASGTSAPQHEEDASGDRGAQPVAGPPAAHRPAAGSGSDDDEGDADPRVRPGDQQGQDQQGRKTGTAGTVSTGTVSTGTPTTAPVVRTQDDDQGTPSRSPRADQQGDDDQGTDRPRVRHGAKGDDRGHGDRGDRDRGRADRPGGESPAATAARAHDTAGSDVASSWQRATAGYDAAPSAVLTATTGLASYAPPGALPDEEPTTSSPLGVSAADPPAAPATPSSSSGPSQVVLGLLVEDWQFTDGSAPPVAASGQQFVPTGPALRTDASPD